MQSTAQCYILSYVNDRLEGELCCFLETFCISFGLLKLSSVSRSPMNMPIPIYSQGSFGPYNFINICNWQRSETIQALTPIRYLFSIGFGILMKDAFHVTNRRESHSLLQLLLSQMSVATVESYLKALKLITLLMTGLPNRQFWRQKGRSGKFLSSAQRIYLRKWERSQLHTKYKTKTGTPIGARGEFWLLSARDQFFQITCLISKNGFSCVSS